MVEIAVDIPSTTTCSGSGLPACMKRKSADSLDIDDEDEDDSSMPTEDKLTAAAARLINTHITLIADKGGADMQLGETIANTRAGSYQGTAHKIPVGKGNTLIIVDPANMTESSSHPHLRKAQIPQHLVDRAVTAGVTARSMARLGVKDPEANAMVGPDDVWVMFDGGRDVQSLLMKPFRRSANKTKIPVMITYDEDSLLANIGRVTVMGSCKCTETMLLVVAADWSCPRRTHVHYKGSNYSDQLGPVLIDSWESDSVWTLSRKDKKTLQGRFKIEAGGSVEAGLAPTSKWKNRPEEPVWFHQKPYNLCDEIVYSYFGRSLIDFSPSGGNFAMIAMRRRLPYVGITCSDFHSECLLKRLLAQVKVAMQDPDDALYRADCVGSGSGDGGETGLGDKDKDKGKEKNTEKNANKKPKAAANKGGNADLMTKLKHLMGNGGSTGDDKDNVDGSDGEELDSGAE